MSLNAKVRCTREGTRLHIKGKIYNIMNGKIESESGYWPTAFNDIEDLNNRMGSKFELVEDLNGVIIKKDCNNCKYKYIIYYKKCQKCTDNHLWEPIEKESYEQYMDRLEIIKDTSKVDENNITKSILLNKEYKSLASNSKHSYWDNICKIQQKQTDKGISKYGQVLEDNLKMDMKTRLEYLQEEMIDGLMYIEHIKALLGVEGVE